MLEHSAFKAACKAWIASDVAMREFSDVEEHALEMAIRAYLDATTPPDVDGLVERLRGIYRIPITNGLGAVGSGEEPDNPNEFVRKFDTSPIQHEAADAIATLSTALSSERAAHEQTKRERDELAKAFAESCSIRERLASTAAVAETRLAEVEKALERHEQGWSNILKLNLLPDRYRATAEELRDHAHTSRCALESKGGEQIE